MSVSTAPKTTRPLVSIPTAARTIFQMPASTLYLWARRGELAGAVQVNGHWYVKVAEARRWLAGAGADVPELRIEGPSEH